MAPNVAPAVAILNFRLESPQVVRSVSPNNFGASMRARGNWIVGFRRGPGS